MAWEEIESVTLGSAAASVSFTSGLSGLKFFRLTAYLANDANNKNLYIRLNNDSGTNYSQQRITALSTTVNGDRRTGQAQWRFDSALLDASNEGSFTALIAKPSASVKAQATIQTGVDASPELTLFGGEWGNTADLINRIDVLANSNNFAAGTSILLEGLAL